jgi:hypothetical protein
MNTTTTYNLEVRIGPPQSGGTTYAVALSVQSDGLWSISDGGMKAAVGDENYQEWLMDVWHMIKTGEYDRIEALRQTFIAAKKRAADARSAYQSQITFTEANQNGANPLLDQQRDEDWRLLDRACMDASRAFRLAEIHYRHMTQGTQ